MAVQECSSGAASWLVEGLVLLNALQRAGSELELQALETARIDRQEPHSPQNWGI